MNEANNTHRSLNPWPPSCLCGEEHAPSCPGEPQIHRRCLAHIAALERKCRKWQREAIKARRKAQAAKRDNS
jgi:hypothetical protein